MTWRLIQSIPLLAKESLFIHKWGETSRPALRKLRFVEEDTGLISETTDLQIKLNKRNKKLEQFYSAYKNLLENKEISIMLIVVNITQVFKPANFFKDFKKKLAKKGINALGYIWVRDIGEIQFKNHLHIIMAITRINKSIMKQLFKYKNSEKYKVELCNSLRGFIKYLKEKDIFAPAGKRSYSASKEFRHIAT